MGDFLEVRWRFGKTNQLWTCKEVRKEDYSGLYVMLQWCFQDQMGLCGMMVLQYPEMTKHLGWLEMNAASLRHHKQDLIL